MTFSRKVFWGVILVISVLLGISALIRYFIFDPVAGNQIIIEQGLVMYKMEHITWNAFLYVHIFTAAIAIIIGPFQFLQKRNNERSLSLHRRLGKGYVLSIMLSGLTGIYLSFYAFGGLFSKMGFLALSLCWIVFTYMAYHHIRHKRIVLHKEWMYRSFAITLVAVSFRIWSGIIGYSLDNFTIGYVSAIWLALIGNILIAEAWIRRKRNKNSSQSKPVSV